MGANFGAWHFSGPERPTYLIQFALATPVVLWAGWPFFVRGARSVVGRNLNMFTLIAMGTGVAWRYSVVAVLAPGLFPAGFRDAHGGLALYLGAAAVRYRARLAGPGARVLRARLHLRRHPRPDRISPPARARRVRVDGSDGDVPSSMPLWPAIGSASAPAEEFQFDGVVLDGRSLWIDRW